MPITIQINCGGSAISPFAADAYYSGGNSNDYTNNTTNTAGVTSPPPASVYSTARYCGSSFTYAVTGLVSATTYKVRLHFSEVGGAGVGARVGNYNVSSGANLTANALTNFDINAAAGGVNIAVVREFNVTPNSSGTITISCAPVSGTNPLLNAFEIIEQPPVSITSVSPLSAGSKNTAYSTTVTATGGAAPYTFAVTSGSLPNGLALAASTGVISGTPTAAGNSTFTITATDSASGTASKSFTLSIAADATPPSTPTITSATAITNAQIDVYWTASTDNVAVAGYELQYAGNSQFKNSQIFSLGNQTGASATAGLSANKTYWFRVRAYDTSYNYSQFSPTVSATTLATTPAMLVLPSMLFSGTTYVSYSQPFTAYGGTGTGYTFTSSGTLPTGLTLSSAGLLSGTPTAAGSYNFTITATDSGSNTASRNFTLPIGAIIVNAPVGSSFDEVILNPFYSAYATGGPEWATAIERSGSGGAISHRNVNREDYVSRYAIQYAELRDNERADLRSFAVLRHGQAYGFRFLAPDLNRLESEVVGRFNATTGQVERLDVAAGTNSSDTVFYFIKYYQDATRNYTRRIIKPDPYTPVTVAIYVAGSLSTTYTSVNVSDASDGSIDFTVSGTIATHPVTIDFLKGTITFTAGNPGAGYVVEISCGFHLPVVFDEDWFQQKIDTSTTSEVNVNVTEILPAELNIV